MPSARWWPASVPQDGARFPEHRRARGPGTVPGEHQRLPDVVTACVGGGSNAMGIFTEFLPDADVQLVGVEPAGRGLDTPDHAATMTLGTKGAIHGFICYNLQDDKGEPLPVYSIASGLDYPGVGPAALLPEGRGPRAV